MLNNNKFLKKGFNDGEVFLLNTDYILEHLIFEDVIKSSTNSNYRRERGNKQATNFMLWQEGKEARIEKVIDELLNPLDIDPIKLRLHQTKELYTVIDGISRLRSFNKNNITTIPTRLYHGGNFSYESNHIFLFLQYK